MTLRFFVFLLILGFAAFFNSLNSPFMLDDFPFLRNFEQAHLFDHFNPDPHKSQGINSPRTQHAYYRPMAHIVPHLNYFIFNNNPLGYHAVNILLLAIAAFLVSTLMSLILPIALSRAVGVLFLLHPINGLMVNYITASVFSVQVILICLCLYIINVTPECSSRGSRFPTKAFGNDLVSIILFILALMCHETSFVVPVYAVLLGLMLGRNLKDTLFQTKWLWLTLLGYIIFRTFNASFSKSLFPSFVEVGLTFDQRIATLMQLMSWYVQKLIVPKDIFLMWSVPFVRGDGWDWVMMLSVAVVGLGMLFHKTYTKYKNIWLLFFWFLVGLTPAGLGAFASPDLGALLEPHWFIPAHIGLMALIVLLISQIKTHKIVFIVLCFALMLFGWVNNHLWASEVRLYQKWLEHSPKYQPAHYFLGIEYSRQKKYDLAQQHLTLALADRYKDWMVYFALGQNAFEQGRVEESRAFLLKAFNLENRHTDILNALGVIELRTQNFAQAKLWFERAIKASPKNKEAQKNLLYASTLIP